MDYAVYVGLASLTLALIAHAVRVTWMVSRIDKEIREYNDAQIDNLSRDILKIERHGEERIEDLRQAFGDTGMALRTKIHEVETWCRDTFVRRESFDQVVIRLENSIEKAFDKMETRIEAMIERIKP